MEIPLPSQPWSMRRDCQSLSRQRTRDHNFPLSQSMGIPVCGHREDRKIEQDEEKSLQQSKRLPCCNGGSPFCSEPRCSVLGNKRAETFPCRIIYCLSHLGQGVSFHPTLAAPLLLPESLGLGRRQLSFSWRSQVQAPGFGKRPPLSP